MYATETLVYREADLTARSDTLPFQFAVPEHPLDPHIVQPYLSQLNQLPSTLKIDFAQPSRPELGLFYKGGCDINYRVCAKLIKDGHCHAETVRPISLFACAVPQPPLPSADFPGEYILSNSSPLRSLFFRSVGMLKICAKEPQPLRFCPDRRSASTTIKLNMRYLPCRRNFSVPFDAFATLPCFIQATLRATTFISVEPQKRSPSIRDTLSTATTTAVVEDGPCQRRKLYFSQWVEPSPALGN